ncbi:FeoA family protein [Aurantivibrio plasticivorans]
MALSDFSVQAHSLHQARPGSRWRVTDIASAPEISSRLFALGLFPGATLDVLRYAPMGDPMQIKVGQTLLSIRRDDAQSIAVEELVTHHETLVTGVA